MTDIGLTISVVIICYAAMSITTDVLGYLQWLNQECECDDEEKDAD